MRRFITALVLIIVSVLTAHAQGQTGTPTPVVITDQNGKIANSPYIAGANTGTSAGSLLTATTATDNFTRANGTLGVNWSLFYATSGNLQIAANLVEASATSSTYEYAFNAGNFPNDQFSQITINHRQAGSNTILGALVRGDAYTNTFIGAGSPHISTTVNGYWCGTNNISTNFYYIYKTVLATYTQLLATTQAEVDGDVVKVVVQGPAGGGPGSATIHCYVNGTELPGSPVTDTPAAFTNGFPGMLLASDGTLADATISAWSGGSVYQSPAIVSAGGTVQLTPGYNTNIGSITALNQAVQFAVPEASNLSSNTYRGQVQIVVPSGVVVGGQWVLEGSQDSGATWFTIPANNFNTFAPMLGDQPAVFGAKYDISGLGGNTIFRFGLIQGSSITTLPVWVQIG